MVFYWFVLDFLSSDHFVPAVSDSRRAAALLPQPSLSFFPLFLSDVHVSTSVHQKKVCCVQGLWRRVSWGLGAHGEMLLQRTFIAAFFVSFPAKMLPVSSSLVDIFSSRQKRKEKKIDVACGGLVKCSEILDNAE